MVSVSDFCILSDSKINCSHANTVLLILIPPVGNILSKCSAYLIKKISYVKENIIPQRLIDVIMILISRW